MYQRLRSAINHGRIKAYTTNLVKRHKYCRCRNWLSSHQGCSELCKQSVSFYCKRKLLLWKLHNGGKNYKLTAFPLNFSRVIMTGTAYLILYKFVYMTQKENLISNAILSCIYQTMGSFPIWYWQYFKALSSSEKNEILSSYSKGVRLKKCWLVLLFLSSISSYLTIDRRFGSCVRNVGFSLSIISFVKFKDSSWHIEAVCAHDLMLQ